MKIRIRSVSKKRRLRKKHAVDTFIGLIGMIGLGSDGEIYGPKLSKLRKRYRPLVNSCYWSKKRN